MKTSRFLFPFAFLLAALFVAAPVAHAQDSTDASAMEAPAEDEDMSAEDLVSVLEADGNFTILVSALQTAGLAETLQNEGPFTVFAPTDEAFEALPAGTLDSLSAEQLSTILSYHVVPGEVMAEDAVSAGTATTVQGGEITIEGDDETVMVNDATVVATDVQASNGVVHVIDAVLMPPSMTSAGGASR